MRSCRILLTTAVALVATTATTMGWPSAAWAADWTPPTVPQDLRVTATTNASVSLAWAPATDSSGSVSYRVYMNSSFATTTTQAGHTQTGLASGQQYAFYVRAVDRFGNVSRASATVFGSVPGTTGPIQGVQNLRSTGVGYDTVSLAWDGSADNVAYYQILRNGQWVDSAYGTSATLRYLAAGVSYVFDVRAVDAQGQASPSASITVATQADAGPPTAPTNLRLTGGAGVPLGLAWDASTDDRGVAMYWLIANGDVVFGGGQEVDFLTLTDVVCTVFHGEQYTFTVHASDLSGNLSPAGATLTLTVP